MHPKPSIYQTYMTIYINNISTFASQTYMIQICPSLSKFVYKPKVQHQSHTNFPKNITFQKTNHYKTGHIPIITFQKTKACKKKKNQCFHFRLFFFSFDSIICNPFLMECIIIFPLAAVEDVATTPLSVTCGVLGVNPTTFPPISPAAIDLAVRSIKTAGWGLIGTVQNMLLILPDSLLGGGGGGLGVVSCLF
jgi:hypothetical protein